MSRRYSVPENQDLKLRAVNQGINNSQVNQLAKHERRAEI